MNYCSGQNYEVTVRRLGEGTVEEIHLQTFAKNCQWWHCLWRSAQCSTAGF